MRPATVEKLRLQRPLPHRDPLRTMPAHDVSERRLHRPARRRPASPALPRTGQATSYAAATTAPSPHGVAWPAQRFVDNGDGSVDGPAHRPGLAAGTPAARPPANWSDALAAAGALASGACGLADGSSAGQWRMPNANELESLVEYRPGQPGALERPSVHERQPRDRVLDVDDLHGATRRGDGDPLRRRPLDQRRRQHRGARQLRQREGDGAQRALGGALGGGGGHGEAARHRRLRGRRRRGAAGRRRRQSAHRRGRELGALRRQRRRHRRRHRHRPHVARSGPTASTRTGAARSPPSTASRAASAASPTDRARASGACPTAPSC